MHHRSGYDPGWDVIGGEAISAIISLRVAGRVPYKYYIAWKKERRVTQKRTGCVGQEKTITKLHAGQSESEQPEIYGVQKGKSGVPFLVQSPHLGC